MTTDDKPTPEDQSPTPQNDSAAVPEATPNAPAEEAAVELPSVGPIETPSATKPDTTAATPAPAPTAAPEVVSPPPAADATSDDAITAEMERALAGLDTAEAPAPDPDGPGDGPRIWHGKIAGVSGEDVFVELGPRMQGVISIKEFKGPPRLGEAFDFVVRGQEDELYLLGRKEVRQMASWRELEKGKLVSARVTGQNTGGLELKIGPVDAFMPASHVALHRVEDLAALIGESITCQVIEVDKRRKRVTLSRRAVLEVEERKNRDEVMKAIAIGEVVQGTVKRLEGFGAFVEIRPGVDGLLHVSQISRKRVNNPSDVLQVGQKVDVQIIKIEDDGRRIGLGMKQLEPDPWDGVDSRFPVDATVTGKVMRVANFGAFVDIGDGVEGLVHISQLGAARGRPVGESAKVGENVEVRVLSVDRERERISLSRLDASGNVIGTGMPPESDGEPDRGRSRGPARGKGGGGGRGPRRDEGPIDQEIREATRYRGGGVNLGDILRKALED